VLNFAVAKGASLLKPAHETDTAATPDILPIHVIPGSRVAPGIEVGETGAFICRLNRTLDS